MTDKKKKCHIRSSDFKNVIRKIQERKNSDNMHKFREKLQSKFVMLALEDDGIKIRSELGDEMFYLRLILRVVIVWLGLWLSGHGLQWRRSGHGGRVPLMHSSL